MIKIYKLGFRYKGQLWDATQTKERREDKLFWRFYWITNL